MSTHECSVRELVDGRAALPDLELSAALTDPDTGEVVHSQRSSSPGSVERALASAWTVHTEGTWFDLSPKERAAALRNFQGELTSRAEELAHADSLDSGVPLTTTTAFAHALPALLEVAAASVEQGFGHAEQTSSSGACDQWRLPWGPAAIFLPWNAPAATAIRITSDALVAGCPVVLKPSEWAPHFSGAFAAAAQAALPAGVVQILHGDHSVGGAIVGDTRIAAVSYTGGVAGGTAVAEACARQLKPVDLELSGNNPVVVLPDAEPAEVAALVAMGMLTLNGQYCVGPRRVIVPAALVDDYLAAFAAALGSVAIGATTDPATQLGPISNEPHLRRIQTQLAAFGDLGCQVLRHGEVPATGHFLAPTVVLADKAPHLQEEVFGPVLILRTYGDLDEAVAIANDHPYGLSAYVFGADRDAARAVGRRLRAGNVRVNSPYGPPDAAPTMSTWGISGLGELGPGSGPLFFTGARFVG